MNKRTIIIIGWIFSSCGFLWFLSFAQYSSFTKTIKPSEMIDSFIFFSIMLIGGGVCYHFLTTVLSTKFVEKHSELTLELREGSKSQMNFNT